MGFRETPIHRQSPHRYAHYRRVVEGGARDDLRTHRRVVARRRRRLRECRVNDTLYYMHLTLFFQGAGGALRGAARVQLAAVDSSSRRFASRRTSQTRRKRVDDVASTVPMIQQRNGQRSPLKFNSRTIDFSDWVRVLLIRLLIL
jgi:hypothetical protein